jgi:hypothetical protein
MSACTSRAGAFARRSFNHGTRPGPVSVSEPRQVELWPRGYTAKCSAPGCRRRATTILRYLDNQGRPDHQTDACVTHASELSATGLKSSAELRVIDRRR